MEQEVKPDVNSKVPLPAIVESTSDAASLNEIKKEFLFSEPNLHGGFVEHGVATHEDTSIQSLNTNIKSEVPDLKYGSGGNDNIHIKLEQLVTEEIHIKNEIDDSLVDQTNLHLSNHTPAKPFQCNVCDFKCTRVGVLNWHAKIHAGKKPFKCSLCDYSCNYKRYLKQHIKIHTDEKPF